MVGTRRYGRRTGQAIAVALTLALGVAAFTLTFSVVHSALLREPPFPDAGRLALLNLERNEPGQAPRLERWSFARFELLRQQQRSFESVASYSPGDVTLSGDGEAELTRTERVSASYFTVLQAGAAHGRLFSESDDDPAKPVPVAVVSDGLWRRRWGAGEHALGRTVRLNGVPVTVIGVMPPGFQGLSGRSDLWVPRTLSAQIAYAEYVTTNQNFISAVGRLRPGVDLAAASGELAVLGGRINREVPSDPRDPDERVTATATSLNRARADTGVRRSLFVLLGAVALLHLLASANVVNLLIGRAAAGRRDAALRLALGSSTRRLFARQFGRDFVLAAAGGIAGVALAAWAAAFIAPPTNVWAPRNFYGSVAPFDAPSFGPASLATGLALALVTALVVALPGALGALRIDVAASLRSGARGIAAGAIRLRRPTTRGVVVGIEAALATVLVISAGLLVDSFRRMERAPIGIESANILTFWVIPSEARVPPAAAPAFVSRVLDAVGRIPGVVSATVDGGAPMAGSATSVLFIDGRPWARPEDAPPIRRHYVAPEHFTTLGIPIRRGRTFSNADAAGAPGVAVISETAARRFFPDENAIGRRVWFGSTGGYTGPDSSAEIVGIVGDVVYAPLDQRQNLASFYTPYAQFTYAPRMVFVRTATDPLSLIPDVRRAIASVDPDLAVREPLPLDDVISGSRTRNRFDAWLFSGFGIAALLLAASGIFAVLAHAVANRTREFGVRIALGARPLRLLSDVVREGLAFPVAGIVLGIGASLWFSQLLRSTLFEVSPSDPRVLAATAAILVLVAGVACLLPAWRATRVDPLEALRSE